MILFTVVAAATVLFLIRGIFPLVQFLRRMSKVGQILRDGFPLMYKDDFHWLLGHLHVHPGPTEAGMLENLDKLSTVSPRAYVFYYGSWRPSLMVSHPETAKVILKTTMPKSTDESAGYKFFKEWLGDGLILSTGPKWVRNRKLLTPAFHFDILKPYVKIFNQSSDTLLGIFEDRCKGEQSTDVFAIMGLYTLENVLKCAFSSSEDVLSREPTTYIKAAMSLAGMIVKRAMSPWLYPDWIYFNTRTGRKFAEYREISHSKAMEVIATRRRELSERGDVPQKRYIDFLDIILLARDVDGTPLTDGEILDEVETFMFAGHDTTRSGISFILYNLARHPEFQQRARAEVQALLVGRDSHEVTWEDLSKMPYLTKCIKESLRLHPPVTLIQRKITETIQIDGHNVPPETLVDVLIYNVHHNPVVWGEDHMTYDPERFAEENISKMDSHAFIPFSAGPRNCIGQHFAMNEMKVTVARILNRFEMSVDDSVRVELVPDAILQTTHGIHLYLKTLH